MAKRCSDSAALVERIGLLQEELLALTNEQTSKTLFFLTAGAVEGIAGVALIGLRAAGLPSRDDEVAGRSI